MAKPKLALVPSAQGDKFYSVLPSSGVGDFSFSRSGGATRINSQGLIETVADGVSRLNYPLIDGVVKGCPHHILEPERRQLIQYSEAFDNSYWTKNGASITSNSTISPDGSLNADLVTEDTSNGFHRFYIITSLTGSHSYSFFIKTNGVKWVGLGAGNTNSLGVLSYFDIVNGIAETPLIGGSSIEYYGDGWYKCTVTGIGNGAGTSLNLYLAQSNLGNSYQGDGTSGVYIYGAQLEEGSYATSYIPNYGTSGGVTRSSETANGSGDASTFNDSEGVLMADISEGYSDNQHKLITINDGTNNKVIVIGYDNVVNRVYGEYYNVSSQGRVIFDLTDATIYTKIALKYDQTNIYFYVNGFLINQASISSVFNNGDLTQLSFSNGSGSQPFYGNTKQIQYYDTALTDSELETLTSWVSFEDMAISQQYSLY